MTTSAVQQESIVAAPAASSLVEAKTTSLDPALALRLPFERAFDKALPEFYGETPDQQDIEVVRGMRADFNGALDALEQMYRAAQPVLLLGGGAGSEQALAEFREQIAAFGKCAVAYYDRVDEYYDPRSSARYQAFDIMGKVEAQFDALIAAADPASVPTPIDYPPISWVNPGELVAPEFLPEGFVMTPEVEAMLAARKAAAVKPPKIVVERVGAADERLTPMSLEVNGITSAVTFLNDPHAPSRVTIDLPDYVQEFGVPSSIVVGETPVAAKVAARPAAPIVAPQAPSEAPPAPEAKVATPGKIISQGGAAPSDARPAKPSGQQSGRREERPAPAGAKPHRDPKNGAPAKGERRDEQREEPREVPLHAQFGKEELRKHDLKKARVEQVNMHRGYGFVRCGSEKVFINAADWRRLTIGGEQLVDQRNRGERPRDPVIGEIVVLQVVEGPKGLRAAVWAYPEDIERVKKNEVEIKGPAKPGGLASTREREIAAATK